MSEKLKPCPFCGVERNFQYASDGTVIVCCQTPSCTALPMTYHETKGEALAAERLNTRDWRGNWSVEPLTSGYIKGYAVRAGLSEAQIIERAIGLAMRNEKLFADHIDEYKKDLS